MTKHPNKFDPIEDRLRREFRQQAERVHVTVQTRERFRKMSVHLSSKHPPHQAKERKALLERLRTFWHGSTEIPIPITVVLVAVMVTSLVVASGVGTQSDGFLWQAKTSIDESSGIHATLQIDGSDETQEDPYGLDSMEIVSLPMGWMDPIW